MRVASLLVLSVFGLDRIEVVAGDAKPIAPKEAIHKVNQEVTVQMLVKATKNRLEKRGEIYLDSEADFRDPNNLAIVITKTGAENFKEAGIDDPAVHFKDKTILATGKVIRKEDRPRIEIDDPKMVRVVEKAK